VVPVLFTEKYPEKVEKLALIAPAGLMKFTNLPFFGRILTFPGVSQLLCYPIMMPLIEKSIITRLDKENKISALADEIKNIVLYQLHKYEGFAK
ncbi:12523_t:CDS:2, partial [Ambispora leptoticha]